MTSLTCGYFVTGTDTEIGKTTIAAGLLYALNQRGLKAIGMKPVAAGAELRCGKWHNDDADALSAHSSVAAPAALTTPYMLRAPTAPHIAAREQGITINKAQLLACYHQLANIADIVVIEGVGGFKVPLSETFDSADLAKSVALPLVLVVGIRLGCINHALLTIDAIASHGLSLAGWAANIVDEDMNHREATIDTIAARVQAPFLGTLPRLPLSATDENMASSVASYLNFSSLIGWPIS